MPAYLGCLDSASIKWAGGFCRLALLMELLVLELKESGATIVKFTDVELAAFAKKCREEVWPIIKGDFGEELFDSITK